MAETTHLAVERQTGDAAGERSAAAIRRDIAAKRESISETDDQLGERLHQTFDWREYIGRHPLAAVGVAMGAGFLASSLFKRRPTPRERIMDAVADLADDFKDRINGFVDSAVPWGSLWARKTATQTLRTFVTAAVA